MEVSVTLYNNSSEPERVSKSLSQVTSFTGHLKEDSSIITPTILMSGDGVVTANYMYIPQFNRYYFINDVKKGKNGLIELYAKCDVLYTYRNQIRACNALIERQESSYNPYLQDNLVPISNDTKQFIAIFNTGRTFNKEHLLLAINSGALKEENT